MPTTKRDLAALHYLAQLIAAGDLVSIARRLVVIAYEDIGLANPPAVERAVTAVPAVHTVPAVGYHLDSGKASLVFTGDTTVNDAFWPVINRIANLKYLLIETAFSNREQQLALTSKHLCPSMLADELARLERDAAVYITHLKPGQVELIMGEIEECIGDFRPKMLQNNQLFEF